VVPHSQEVLPAVRILNFASTIPIHRPATGKDPAKKIKNADDLLLVINNALHS
jgi:hypothetical protein